MKKRIVLSAKEKFVEAMALLVCIALILVCFLKVLFF